MSKNHVFKTVDIKGKDYVQVNERIKYFRQVFPEGRILTNIVEDKDGRCLFKAEVYNNGTLVATGHAYEKETSSFINKTSYIENCETSAVGRALGFLGIGIDSSIATAEEVETAIINQVKKPRVTEIDGVKYPHVTDIISLCEPKFIPDIDKHSYLGSQYDEAWKNFIDGKGFGVQSEIKYLAEWQELNVAHDAWVEEHIAKFDFKGHSIRVVSEKHVYCGEIDAKGLYEGRSAIFDFKKTKTITGKVKLDYLEQLCAYRGEDQSVECLVIISPFNKPIMIDGEMMAKGFSAFLKKRKLFKEKFGF